MIEADFNPATTWAPECFNGGVLFVRHEGHGYVGGMLSPRGSRFAQADWLDCARKDPPEWYRGPEKFNSFHSSGWEWRSRSRTDAAV